MSQDVKEKEPTIEQMEKAKELEIAIYNRKSRELIESMSNIVAIDNRIIAELSKDKQNTKKSDTK